MLIRNNSERDDWVLVGKEAVLAAGSAIMHVYNASDFSVEYKADKSPVTEADRAAHNIIKNRLAVTGMPLLSEEGKAIPYKERRQWERFWLVDPLDGTKEFVNRNKEFTVNIALIEKGRPLIGVIYAPALDLLYWNDFNGNAWKQQKDAPAQQIHSRPQPTITRIVASKMHLTAETEAFIRQFPNAHLQTIGSSLKFMLVAEGTADCYPRLGPTMEWDTAAAQAIVEASGGKVVQYDSHVPVRYNKNELLNPWFVAKA